MVTVLKQLFLGVNLSNGANNTFRSHSIERALSSIITLLASEKLIFSRFFSSLWIFLESVNLLIKLNRSKISLKRTEPRLGLEIARKLFSKIMLNAVP